MTPVHASGTALLLPSGAVNGDPAFESKPPGCGLAAAAASVLLGLAALGFWIGFFVVDPPNYFIVFAALPVSAFFTVLGALLSSASSDFLLAWPVDFGLWLAVAFVASRWATRKDLKLARVRFGLPDHRCHRPHLRTGIQPVG